MLELYTVKQSSQKLVVMLAFSVFLRCVIEIKIVQFLTDKCSNANTRPTDCQSGFCDVNEEACREYVKSAFTLYFQIETDRGRRTFVLSMRMSLN